jgi:hypothetical protein
LAALNEEESFELHQGLDGQKVGIIYTKGFTNAKLGAKPL